jgi:hypothetical protein
MVPGEIERTLSMEDPSGHASVAGGRQIILACGPAARQGRTRSVDAAIVAGCAIDVVDEGAGARPLRQRKGTPARLAASPNRTEPEQRLSMDLATRTHRATWAGDEQVALPWSSVNPERKAR